ncbi:hypothetical protein D3C86_995530 [compost metagenome]
MCESLFHSNRAARIQPSPHRGAAGARHDRLHLYRDRNAARGPAAADQQWPRCQPGAGRADGHGLRAGLFAGRNPADDRHARLAPPQCPAADHCGIPGLQFRNGPLYKLLADPGGPVLRRGRRGTGLESFGGLCAAHGRPLSAGTRTGAGDGGHPDRIVAGRSVGHLAGVDGRLAHGVLDHVRLDVGADRLGAGQGAGLSRAVRPRTDAAAQGVHDARGPRGAGRRGRLDACP